MTKDLIFILDKLLEQGIISDEEYSKATTLVYR